MALSPELPVPDCILLKGIMPGIKCIPGTECYKNLQLAVRVRRHAQYVGGSDASTRTFLVNA